MTTITRQTLARLRGQIIGWGLGIGALGLLLVAYYGVFMEEQANFMQMIESYPAEFLAFFGGDSASIATPEGFLGMYGFSMLPVIIGIFAVIAGSGLIASDEESGRLDLLVAYPVSRSAFFLGRCLGLLLATLGIILLAWLGFVALLGGSALDLSAGQMLLPFITLGAQALIYAAFALLLSLLLPARRLAAMGAGVLLVASYLLSSLSFLNEGLELVARFLPYAYFQGSDALNGLNFVWLGGLLIVTAAFVMLSWWFFLRRDIRVAGEGSWKLPRLRLRRPAGQPA
jgi:ABC-2 type transport system permease protein